MTEAEALDAPVTLAAPVLKWASWPGNNGMATPATTAQIGNLTGLGTGGQAPGAVAIGDLLIVVAHAGKAGGINNYTLSGSGWNLFLTPSAGDAEIKIFAWWKIADASDVTAAGVYTVTWGGTSPEAWSWAEWNFGQNAFIDAWNGIWSNVITNTNAVNPSCSPTGTADTLLTYWFSYHNATNWVVPTSGFTTVFNNTQGILPSQGASSTKVLSAAGPTGNLIGTIGTNQQYGALQIAISTGSPPNGGGGGSPIKWTSFQATQPTIATANHIVVGQDAISPPLGPFASGDLYIVAVTIEADTGVTGTATISGTGWTQIANTSIGPLNTHLVAWAKNVSGGETGIYTVSWPNATGNANWTVWNYGQATLDATAVAAVCAAPSGTTLAAPSITTTQANETVLAYWFLVDTTGPGVGIPAPSTIVPRAINLQGQFKWDMTNGDYPKATAGATGALNATGPSGMPVYTAFQVGIIPNAGGSAPAAPTGLTATAVSSSQINLSWTASAGATSYIVLRGGSSVGTPSGTTFNNTGLTASTSYTYTVEAVNAGGTSSPSSPASATTFASGSSPFPAFSPVLPPPLVGAGGAPSATIVVPAGVPPSIAGKALIIFGTGSASSPTAASWFPSFTTTFPAPTVVFSNVWTVPTLSGGNWTSTLPARTPTTPPLGNSYNTGGTWGSPGPSGSGPGPPTGSNPPGAGRPFLASVESDEAAPEMEPHLAAAENGATASRRRRRPSA